MAKVLISFVTADEESAKRYVEDLRYMGKVFCIPAGGPDIEFDIEQVSMTAFTFVDRTKIPAAE